MPIRQIEQYQVLVVPKEEVIGNALADLKLFFINLGAYAPNDPEEYHQRLIVAASDIESAKTKAKEHFFFVSHGQLSGGQPHIDDKYAIDDILDINNLIPGYSVVLTRMEHAIYQLEPVVNGYFPLDATDPFRRSQG